MAVHVRGDEGPLEPVKWPTGEDVAVKRPNLHAARFWNRNVTPALDKGDEDAAMEAMVKFVALCCTKTEEQIWEECDTHFLMLFCGYVRGRLEAAQQFVTDLMGKSPAGTAPASAPPTSTGTSEAESPAPTAVASAA